ncbi:uncharacterized protein LOC144026277 [Festucalex cinctus]
MRTTLRLLLLLLLLIPYGGKSKLGDNEVIILFFWIRLASGTFPEFLGQTTSFDLTGSQLGTSNSGRRITARQEPGKFVLQISQVRKSDMAVYYCLKSEVWVHDMTFLRGVFLQVKDFPEAEPSVSDVTQDLRSDESQLQPSVTAQCSVLSRSENKTCTDGHKVYWFRTGKVDKPPSFIYTREECKNVQNGATQKCVYAFSKDVSASDAGTYACAVATCGEIFMGKATKVVIEDARRPDLWCVIIVLGAALTLSFILSAFLICKIKTESCFDCKGCPQTHDETSIGVRQRNEDSLVYSTPNFAARKNSKRRQTSVGNDEEFSTYADVCLHET